MRIQWRLLWVDYNATASLEATVTGLSRSVVLKSPASEWEESEAFYFKFYFNSAPLRRRHLRRGWGGIRTPGAFQHTRFPGVHNQPLCHPSTIISCSSESYVSTPGDY